MEDLFKKTVAHLRNGYGFEFQREFDTAEDYLEWKRSLDQNYWNKQNTIYMELIKVTTKFLPLDWTKSFSLTPEQYFCENHQQWSQPGDEMNCCVVEIEGELIKKHHRKNKEG